MLGRARTDGSGLQHDVRSRTERHEPPYEVRGVFACHERGQLDDATGDSNYLGAVGPGEDATTIYRTSR